MASLEKTKELFEQVVDHGVRHSSVTHVEATIRGIAAERFHAQALAIKHVSFAELDHCTFGSDATPRFIQQVSCQRVQDCINAIAVCSCHDLSSKRDITRVENVIGRDASVLNQEATLLLTATGSEYFCADVLAKLDTSQTQATRCRMDQYLRPFLLSARLKRE
jgi:hypothetical protein